MYSQKGTAFNEGPYRSRTPLKAHCSFCYNTILNPLPLSLFGSEEAVKELNLTSLRLSFTREGKEETKKILEAFAASYKEGRS